uniref:protein-histidine N-methyltransferase n=1 Tax=Rhodosorus marinus TaxID=101924 RepID=A0A7S2ZIR1_9RHOD|mmetsp:Transcript_20990/g.85577  ORF Transcript_20990/g.85577 Transcript_20990/m.85577 type:complete len:353 (+) Transcript_20990:2632-3690(+)
MGGRDRVRVKRVSELVSSLEAVAFTEAKWERDRVGALRDLVRAEEELIRAQGGVGMGASRSFGDRWEVFEEWANKFGVDTAAFRAEKCGDQGVGLVAERDIRLGEKLIHVPRQMMITADIALKNADMAHLFQTDILLRRIESLALSMCVLRERLLGSQSNFAPYLDILPHEFSTPLWFTPDEIVALKGSPVLDKATNRVRGHARQYCHLYNVVKSGALPSIPPTQFTFELFRWAVSVVMTRQNMVPTSTGGESLALIPLWDMINHSQGEYTTQYDLARDQVEFFAMTDTPRDKQILMFYGPRPNSELLLHAGFVHGENLHDAVEVKQGRCTNRQPVSNTSSLIGRGRRPYAA